MSSILANEVSLRHNLRTGDLPRIVELHGQIYNREHDYDHTFEAYVAEPLSQFVLRDNPRERLWLVEKDNSVEGCIAICEATDSQAQLRWFLLSEKLRGQGLGDRLLSTAEAFCKDNHYSEIQLWTVKGLQAARALYVKHGYQLHEEIEHHVWGANRTEQQFVKFL